jgi:GT2 family glycosyltransferase
VRLLKSLEETKYDEMRVVIVDSTFPESRYQNFNLPSYVIDDSRIQRIHTTKGLPGARNLAVEHAESDELVVFLDDDVSVPNDFFNKIDSYFKHNQGISALGVRIVGQYTTTKGISKRMMHPRKARNFGRITKSAENFWVPDTSFGMMPVEWLPGCCMIFRSEVFGDIRFNELLENGPTGGYALGEDVDFSYACSRKFTMHATDTVAITHHFESSSRENERLMSIANGMFKAHLKNAYPESFSDFKIILSQCLKFAWIFKGRKWIKALSLSGAFVYSYFRERIEKRYLLRPNLEKRYV